MKDKKCIEKSSQNQNHFCTMGRIFSWLFEPRGILKDWRYTHLMQHRRFNPDQVVKMLKVTSTFKSAVFCFSSFSAQKVSAFVSFYPKQCPSHFSHWCLSNLSTRYLQPKLEFLIYLAQEQ